MSEPSTNVNKSVRREDRDPPAVNTGGSRTLSTTKDSSGLVECTCNHHLSPSTNEVDHHLSPSTNEVDDLIKMPVLEDLMTPLQFFNTFWPKTLLKRMKEATNEYASRIMLQQLSGPQQKNFHDWEPVSVNDLHGFFAIITYMSQVSRRHISDYFDSYGVSDFIHSRFVTDIFSYRRFMQIYTFLSLSIKDNHATGAHVELPSRNNPLALGKHLSPIVDSLRHTLAKLWPSDSETNVAKNKITYPFRSHLRFRRHVKGKPKKKCEIVISQPCESSSKHMLDFEIQRIHLNGRKQLPDANARKKKDETSRYGDEVFQLNDRQTGINFCESSVTAVATTDEEADSIVKPTGMSLDTASSDLKIDDNNIGPSSNDKLPNASEDFQMNSINQISTNHNLGQNVSTLSSEVEVKTKLSLVDLSNFENNNNNVNVVPWFSPLRKRNSKRWKKFFSHIFNFTLVQSYVLFSKCVARNECVERKTFRKFISALGIEMADDFRRRSFNKRPNPPEPGPHYANFCVKRLSQQHYPELLPLTNLELEECIVCSLVKEKQGEVGSIVD